MTRKFIAILIVGFGLLIGLTACNTAKSSPQSTADKKQAESYVSKCVPSSSLGQIQLAEKLGTDPAQRTQLSQCLGVPKDQRQNFEAAVLGDAEHVQWSNKAARTQFYSVTLPNTAEHYRNTK